MQQATEKPVVVTTRRVACDGGVGALGHPRVFLTIPDSGSLLCPYCGKPYVLDAHAEEVALSKA